MSDSFLCHPTPSSSLTVRSFKCRSATLLFFPATPSEVLPIRWGEEDETHPFGNREKTGHLREDHLENERLFLVSPDGFRGDEWAGVTYEFMDRGLFCVKIDGLSGRFG